MLTPDVKTAPRAEASRAGWRWWSVPVAAVGCGGILLAAAALKIVGWNVSPFAQYGWLLSPTVQAVGVIWEVLLGVWLLSRKSPYLSWIASVITFAGFAVVSGYLGIIGQASCGCFGVIEASPWAAFAVDVIALGLLAVGRPPVASRAEVVGSVKWVSGLAAVFAVLSLVALFTFGSLNAAVARLRGESFAVSPSTLDFGSGSPGQLLSADLTVRNYSAAPARLIGGTSDCSCIITQDLPVTIPPGESATIRVRLKVPPASSGQMNRQVELFTDHPNQQTIRFTAGCRVE